MLRRPENRPVVFLGILCANGNTRSSLVDENLNLISELCCFLFVGSRHSDAGLELQFALGMRPDGDIPLPMIQANGLACRQRQTLLEITCEVLSIRLIGRQRLTGYRDSCTERIRLRTLLA